MAKKDHNKLITKDVYIKQILQQTPRLLGLLNRNISSSSYGSFDREYWHYNTVDFSNARKQEAVLTLTLLYQTKHENNKYYQSEEIFEYIKAALIYWTKIQSKNGSFSEWYPNENSFVVTSFSSYAVSESLLLLRDELPENEFQTVLRSLIKAGDWLIRRNETRVMNQQTGAAIALFNIYLLTDNAAYLDASKQKVDLLGQKQSTEGWFLEYGGPDIGYLSLAIDYLCKLYVKTKDAKLKNIIYRAVAFIKYFIQPDLIAGGTYASRNTEYLIPHGFELFSPESNDAAFVASIVRKSLIRYNSFPNLFDDRYLTYVGYTWLQAYQDANPQLANSAEGIIDGHFNNFFEKEFKESGLFIKNDDKNHLIVNMKKGGAFRLFDKTSGKAYTDSGIYIRSGGDWYTSGWLVPTKTSRNKDEIMINGKLWKVPDKALSPFSNIALRLFQISLGRWSFISLWIKERLRDVLITKTKPSNIRYNRKISILDDSDKLLQISDTVESGDVGISSISVFTADASIYVPSSRYYVCRNELPIRRDFSRPLKKVEIEWTVSRKFGVILL